VVCIYYLVVSKSQFQISCITHVAERTFTLRSVKDTSIPNVRALLQYADASGKIKGTFDITDTTIIERVPHATRKFVFRITTTLGRSDYVLLCCGFNEADTVAWIEELQDATGKDVPIDATAGSLMSEQAIPTSTTAQLSMEQSGATDSRRSSKDKCVIM
jgi:hypothetical protein